LLDAFTRDQNRVGGAIAGSKHDTGFTKCRCGGGSIREIEKAVHIKPRHSSHGLTADQIVQLQLGSADIVAPNALGPVIDTVLFSTSRTCIANKDFTLADPFRNTAAFFGSSRSLNPQSDTCAAEQENKEVDRRGETCNGWMLPTPTPCSRHSANWTRGDGFVAQVPVQILGQGPSIEGPDVIPIAGDAVSGVIYAGSDLNLADPATSRFVEGFKQRTGKDPDLGQVIFYDTTQLLAKVMAGAGTEPTALRDGLLASGPQKGIAGEFQIAPDRTAEWKTVIKTFKDGRFVAYGQ